MAKGSDLLIGLGFILYNIYTIISGPMSYQAAYAKLQQLKRAGEVAEEYRIDERNYTRN